jgi:hypothetical protein
MATALGRRARGTRAGAINIVITKRLIIGRPWSAELDAALVVAIVIATALQGSNNRGRENHGNKSEPKQEVNHGIFSIQVFSGCFFSIGSLDEAR